MENIIFKVRVGSHAYGTNIEGSDEDFKGVYIQNPNNVLERGYQEQVNVSKDECYYEIKRFFELCCSGNPTMLEILYSPEDCIIYKHPIFDQIIENRKKFLSKSCRYSFGGYAYAQIEKAEGLEKKMNWEKSRTERKTILDFCYILIPQGSTPLKDWLAYQKKNLWDYKNYGAAKIPNCRDLYYIYPKDKEELEYRGLTNDSESSNELRLCSIPVSETLKGIPMSYNKDGYMEHCRDYKSYQEWLLNRNTQRYVDIENHSQKVDGKNLLHCYRLLETGIEIATLETINVRRPNADFLIGIRKGKYDLKELLTNAKTKIEELSQVFKESNLPDSVDRSYWMKLLVKIRKEYYNLTT